MGTCVIGLAGWSGAGKTTLPAKALPLIVARGLTVSTLKHAHHSFDLDQPGKDSHTHRTAGAHSARRSRPTRIPLHYSRSTTISMRIHKTLRTTPAMAANVTERLWEIGDIADVSEGWEAAKNRHLT